MKTINRKAFFRVLLSGVAGLPFVAKALGKVNVLQPRPSEFTIIPYRGLVSMCLRPLIPVPKEWKTVGKYDISDELVKEYVKALERRMDETALNAINGNE